MAKILTAAGVLTLAVTAFAPLSAQAPSERKLQVTFDQQGNVTVVAQNVTISEILAEWGRQGGTTMVNANRLTGAPMSRFYQNEPEGDVIASLLRQAAGYIVTARRAGVPGASRFEVVHITPTTVTNSSFTSVPSAPMSAPVTTPGSPNDELPPIMPPGVAAPPPVATPPPPQQTTPAPGYPGSVAVPVVPIVPVPGGRTGGAPPTTPPPGTTGRGGGGL